MAVDAEGIPPGNGNGDAVARLVALTERQHELWALLRDARDEDERNRLFDELTSNREELARLKATVNAQLETPVVSPQTPPPPPPPPRSVGEELRSKIVTPDDASRSPAPPPPPTSPPAAPAHTAPQPSSPQSPTPPPREPSPPAGSPPPGSGKEEHLENEPGRLLPEKTPFSSREADLAATRGQHPDPTPEQPQSEPADVLRSQPVPPEPGPGDTPPPGPMHPVPSKDATPEPPSERRHLIDDERRRAAHESLREIERVRPKHARPFPIFALLVAIVAVAAVAWFLFFFRNETGSSDPSGETTGTTAAVAGPATAATSAVSQIRAVLDGLGLSAVAVEERSGTIFLTGTVGSDNDREAAIGAAGALAGGMPVNADSVIVGVTDAAVRSAALQAIADAGYDRINVTVSGGVATLTGVTPGEGAAGLIAAVSAVPGINQVVDLTEGADRALALESELNRVVGSTPIVFAIGQTTLNTLQERILDNVAEIIQAYEGPLVTIVGYTDAAGAADENERISLIRAENVRDYLVAQGVASERLAVEALGEASSSGSAAVAGLERRVEFEVGYSVEAGVAGETFRIGIVAPSARDDLAFTQSIVDATAVIAEERNQIQIDIADGLFVTDDAVAAIRGYADSGYDLVIAHGSQYGTSLAEIAPQYPNTAFAWGTAADTFGQPNISAYEVASDQGGYVMGVVAALLSENDVIGVIGPLEVGDAQLFVDGFVAGALTTNPEAEVPVLYTGSFSDVALAAEAAQAHIAAGADVLTGTAQMVVGAVGVARDNDALWFGTQSNQTELAPDLVVASQVYHWEVVLRQIITGIEQGDLGGESYTINLANGGVVIEYNPEYPLPEGIRDTADDTVAGLIDNTISTGSSGS